MLSPASRDGIEAFVRRVDGRRFNEYEVVQRKDLGSKPPTTCAYLESEENAEFEAGVTFHDAALARYRDHDWRITVHVDGRLIHNCVHTRDDPDCCVKEMKFIEDGQRKRGKLCFTALPTTDDESRVTLRGNDLIEIGNIQIDLYRGVDQGTRHGQPATFNYLSGHELGIANEKDKKWSAAIGVCDVSNDDREGTYRSVKWHAIDNVKPYHRFTFMYRTRAVLELIKVVGRPTGIMSGLGASASKKKAEVIYISDSDDDDLTSTEIRGRSTPAPLAPIAVRTPPSAQALKRKRTFGEDDEGRLVKPLLHPMARMSLDHTSRD